MAGACACVTGVLPFIVEWSVDGGADEFITIVKFESEGGILDGLYKIQENQREEGI